MIKFVIYMALEYLTNATLQTPKNLPMMHAKFLHEILGIFQDWSTLNFVSVCSLIIGTGNYQVILTRLQWSLGKVQLNLAQMDHNLIGHF